jgi:Fe-S cluster assembly ATP-binding protein
VVVVTASSTPVTESLNSRIPLPSERPISGRRFAPKMSSSTTRRIMSSQIEMPNGMSARYHRLVGPTGPATIRAGGRFARWFLREAFLRMSQLEIRNLHVALEDGTEIVKGVDLVVASNEKHAIMGPNGSGKSTLAYALMGHPAYEITEGQILFDDEDVTELGADERSQRGLFLAFQYPHAIPGVSVTSFLRSAINAQRKAANGGEDNPVPIPEFRTELLTAMEELKVPRELASRYLNDGFSGGEKKRVEILQMAMLKPKIAVLDETDSGLDIDALKVVARGVNALVGPEMGAVVITHYQRILNYVTPDFVHVFVDGRIVAEGGPELAHKLEAEGYEAFTPAGVTGGD